MRALAVAVAVAASGCDGAMDAYFAQDVVAIERDVPYRDGADNPRQQLDLFVPRAVDDFPVVVFVHGGYWIAQDKRYFEPIVGLYSNVGIALARRGIGVAVINYRLCPGVSFDDELSDVAHAVAWTQAHIGERGGDPTRMVIAGHSAGGHMTALLAFDDDRLAAAGVDRTAIRGYVPLSPILDLQQMADHPPRAGFNDEVTGPVFGDDLVTDSPRTYFAPTVAPMLIVMGEHDEPYLTVQIPAAVDELQALGAPVELHTLAGHSHDDIVLNFGRDGDQLTPLVDRFVHDVTR